MKKFLKDLPFYVFCFLLAVAIDTWLGFRKVKYKLGFKMDYPLPSTAVAKHNGYDTPQTA